MCFLCHTLKICFQKPIKGNPETEQSHGQKTATKPKCKWAAQRSKIVDNMIEH